MEQVTDALSAGISDYLIKPCKRADLARTLAHWEHVVHTNAEHKPTLDKVKASD
jgi:response regulator of citrate/malate metabolism